MVCFIYIAIGSAFPKSWITSMSKYGNSANGS